MQAYNRNNMMTSNQNPNGSRRQSKLNPAQEAAITAFHDKIMNNIQTFKEDNDKIRAQIQQVRRMSQVQRRKSDFIEETLKEITGKNYSRKMDQNGQKSNQPKQAPSQSQYQPPQLSRQNPPTQPFNQIISNNYPQRPPSYSIPNNFQQENFSTQNQLLSRIAEAQKRAFQFKSESQRLRKQADTKRNMYGSPQLAALFQESQQLKSNATRLIRKKEQQSQNRSYQGIKSPTYQSNKLSKFSGYDSGKFDKYELPKYQPVKYSTYETSKYEPKKYDTSKYDTSKYDTSKYETNKYDTNKYDTKKYDTSKYESTNKIQTSKYKADTYTYKAEQPKKTGSVQAASVSFPTKLNVTSVVSTSQANKEITTKTQKSPTNSKKIDNQAILQDMKRVM